ncbi:MAG: RNA methyltransferase [Opitutaceae bacterium]|jgi:TrmH RNA methyltransferase|nr:RNA methyltransferase [Opitutaceae bacterium]
MPSADKTIALCGLAAVRARFRKNPASIRRLYFDQPTSRHIGILCKALAAARKTYRCVAPAELEKLSGSIHHGGIVAVADAPVAAEPAETDIAAWAAAKTPLLLLDRVGNAHNLGAIVRTAAFLGLTEIILTRHPESAPPSAAAHRVAEGGFEHVNLWLASEPPALLRRLAAAGHTTAAAVAQAPGSVTPEQLGQAAAAARAPVALVLGNEERGPSPETVAACGARVHIRGSGKVESLNVSAAAAILIHALLARNAANRR